MNIIRLVKKTEDSIEVEYLELYNKNKISIERANKKTKKETKPKTPKEKEILETFDKKLEE